MNDNENTLKPTLNLQRESKSKHLAVSFTKLGKTCVQINAGD